MKSSAIPYFWQFEGAKSGPTVTILGGMHGNERVGIEVISGLLRIVKERVIKGVLNLAIGNPLACELNLRYVQKDANRCFGYNPGNSEEAQRIALLKPFLAVSDVMLDVHSTIKKAAPFLTVPKMDHPLIDCVSQLGISRVITGPGLWPKPYDPLESDLFVAHHGGLGVTIEAGYHEDSAKASSAALSENFDPHVLTSTLWSKFSCRLASDAFAEASQEKCHVQAVRDGVLRALVKLGVIEAFDKLAPFNDHKALEILTADEYVIAGPNFRFTKDWQNFEKVSAGTIYAYEGTKPLVVDTDSLIIFAKPVDKIVVGEQVCTLLRISAII